MDEKVFISKEGLEEVKERLRYNIQYYDLTC